MSLAFLVLTRFYKCSGSRIFCRSNVPENTDTQNSAYTDRDTVSRIRELFDQCIRDNMRFQNIFFSELFSENFNISNTNFVLTFF